jgi:hypothetical protein
MGTGGDEGMEFNARARGSKGAKGKRFNRRKRREWRKKMSCGDWKA